MNNESLKHDEPAFGAVLKELAGSTRELFESKIDLARAELKSAGTLLKNYAVLSGVFALVALLSVPPFLAFLVIGLGQLLDGNYWLSALIVSLTFAIVGGSLSVYYFKKLTGDAALPETQKSVKHDLKQNWRTT